MKGASIQPSNVRAPMLAWLLLALAAGAASATAPAPAVLERLPLGFEANQGQAAPEAQFVARSQSGTFLLSPAQATILLTTEQGPTLGAHARPAERLRHRQVQSHTLSLQFLGANSRALMTGLDTLPGKVNYFLGSEPARWRTNLPLFERVRVAEVYPGVDLVYYGNQQKLEYDLIVAPGADAGAVRLRITGADRLELDAQGDLVLTVGLARLRQHKPMIHQVIGGALTPVTGGYRLIDPQTVAFEVGRYDAQSPLVIDPVLSYASCFGGGSTDAARAIAVDATGVYLAGQTFSGSLPTTNAFQPRYAGDFTGAVGDAFVAKFNTTGSSLIYMTYLGGSGADAALAIAVDTTGNAYLTGVTDSTDFPHTNAIRSVLTGTPSPIFGLRPFDAFVTKLNANGSALVYSTYLGGDGQDEGIGIAVDAANNVYVTGVTESTNFQTTASAWQTNLAGIGNAFITKLGPAGTNLVYSTCLGGTNYDQGNDIAVDAAGRAFVAGVASSTNFFTTNAVQPWLGGGNDAFVAVVAADGRSLVTSTFLGGAADDDGYRIALDGAGGAYLVGTEASTFFVDASFPITPGNLNPGGVFISSDAGATWSAANVGLYHSKVLSLAPDPAMPGRVYAGTGHGVARSVNGGASWVGTTNAQPTDVGLAPQIAAGYVTALAVNPANPSTLYAGTYGGLYRSLDGGLSWTLNNALLVTLTPFVTVSAIVVDPQTPTTLYEATTGYGVFWSTNSATNWMGVSSGLGTLNVTALAIDPQTPTRLYGGTGGGVYRSDNQGGVWTLFNNGLTNYYILALAVDPQVPSTLYAGTQGGLFKSMDRGTNWFPLPLGVGFTNSMQVQALAIDPSAPTTVYAGTTNGLFKSLDRGLTWSVITNGLSVGTVASLAVEPANPAKLYAGTAPIPNLSTSDAFLIKLTNNATAIQFSTVLNGSGVNAGWAVAVDGGGNSYIVGNTTATNFPTLGANGVLTATNHGGNDVFVTAINADASAFLYSVCLGGSSDDFGYGIALDPAGSAWVVGQTLSADFPTNNAFQATFGGGSGGDAFLARISPTPVLAATRLGSTLQLQWLDPGSQFTLQRAAALPVPTNGWTTVSQTPVVSNGWHTVTLPIAGPDGFFRLQGF